MTSLYAVVAVLTAAVISSTDAVAPCDQDIVDLLETTEDCYDEGRYPPIMALGRIGTYMKISDEALPEGTHCATEIGPPGSAEKIFYGKDNNKIEGYTVRQSPQFDYHVETDPKGDKYRLYVIHNEERVYSYYRCIDGNAEGNGKHMGAVYVDCKYVRNTKSNAVIEKAARCFAQIGITNIIDLTPCPSTLCK